MPSPFPGMNPYLEHPAVWHDFHGIYVTLMRLELARQLRGRYQVRMDDNIYVHELDAKQRRLLGRADVHVAGDRSVPGQSTVILAPVQGTLPTGVDVLREHFVEIRDAQGQRIVTVIELLSPTNKRPGPDREQYLAKRRQYLAGEVNLIEIDLLRGGERMPVDGLPPCDYCVVVSPGALRPQAGLWPIQLADALPEIPVPLSTNDASAQLQLQSLLRQAFDDGGYGPELYALPLNPSLESNQLAWAKSLEP